VNNPKSHL